MKVAVFDTHRYDQETFLQVNRRFRHELVFFDSRLTADTVPLAEGAGAVCSFVNDRVDRLTLEKLHAHGIHLVALRSAGYNHVDLEAAEQLGIRVVRVPEYSPHAVAEYAVTLLLALVRNIHRASARVRDANFSLEGLVGFNLYGKTVGVIGTGRIGAVFAATMRGFGCSVLAYDIHEDECLARDHQVRYVSLNELYAWSDVISLHVPLNPKTYHLLDDAAFRKMKKGVVLVNTGRGALIDTVALIQALKEGRVGAAGLDVYEEEEGLFFRDLSDQVLQDDVMARLLTFPNVLISSHQAFLTREALAAIAETTLKSIRDFEEGRPLANEVRAEKVMRPKPVAA